MTYLCGHGKGKIKAVIKWFALGLFIIFFSVAASPPAFGEKPSHLDRVKNPEGCAGCHRGHGKKGTSMLRNYRSEMCFSCHSLRDTGRSKMARTDMYSVFNKTSRHPVGDTYMYHYPGEDLPERNYETPRHVDCADCHRVHELQSGKPTKGVGGYRSAVFKKKEAVEEFEICYKCHSDSANLPSGSKNKREEFDINNASYHPVEAPGRNSRVPSLISPYNVASLIKCSDCHGNDDIFGPRGPHGSNYKYLLKGNYVMSETAETTKTYELCYFCHDRQSILANDSFYKHKEHIVYQQLPCSACHTPHGTLMNSHLIQFDVNYVGTMPPPTYMPANGGKPLCYLTCHVGGRDVSHDNAFYWGTSVAEGAEKKGKKSR